jgi:hypothetical protein
VSVEFGYGYEPTLQSRYKQFVVKYADPYGNAVPVVSCVSVNGKVETQVHGKRVDGGLASNWPETQARDLNQAFRAIAPLLTVEPPFKVPDDWNGQVQIKGCVHEDDAITWAESLGVTPEFFGVYVQDWAGAYQHVLDFATMDEADVFAQALKAAGALYGNTVPASFWDRRHYEMPVTPTPELPLWANAWSCRESDQAHQEHWDVFRETGDRSAIGYLAEPNVNATQALVATAEEDAAACAHVLKKALQGSELHLKAILYTFAWNAIGNKPLEYKPSALKAAPDELGITEAMIPW